MSTTDSAPACSRAEVIGSPLRALVATRFADYMELTKPRIAVLALVAVAVGYSLGAADRWHLAPLVNALLGTGLVAAASSALNQYIERKVDAKMKRTADRPLPAGRLHSSEVLFFGLSAGLSGCLYLALTVNLLTAGLALTTLLLYTAVYTPLKRVTSFCTAVGAVPGAMPPVLGWTAAGGSLDAGAFSLLAVLFLWQFPHFLAIAWLYREEYERAGLRMLPVTKSTQRVAGILSVAYASTLVPVSLLPSHFGIAGNAYSLAAAILGLGYLFSAIWFLFEGSQRSARRLIWTSLVYLPSLLLAMTWNHFQLLQ